MIFRSIAFLSKDICFICGKKKINWIKKNIKKNISYLLF